VRCEIRNVLACRPPAAIFPRTSRYSHQEEPDTRKALRFRAPLGRDGRPNERLSPGEP
jgi:hypothetical protein